MNQHPFRQLEYLTPPEHAGLEEKESALARLTSPETPSGRYQPDDQLLAFLRSL